MLGEWKPEEDPWYIGFRFIAFSLFIPVIGIVISVILLAVRMVYFTIKEKEQGESGACSEGIKDREKTESREGDKNWERGDGGAQKRQWEFNEFLLFLCKRKTLIALLVLCLPGMLIWINGYWVVGLFCFVPGIVAWVLRMVWYQGEEEHQETVVMGAVSFIVLAAFWAVIILFDFQKEMGRTPLPSKGFESGTPFWPSMSELVENPKGQTGGTMLQEEQKTSAQADIGVGMNGSAGEHTQLLCPSSEEETEAFVSRTTEAQEEYEDDRAEFWSRFYDARLVYTPDDFMADDGLTSREIVEEGKTVDGMDPAFDQNGRDRVRREVTILLDDLSHYSKMDGGIQTGGPYSKSYFDADVFEYIYYGELNDKERPEGIGVLLKRMYNGRLGEIFVIQYAGEFEAGRFSGYGILFSLSESYGCVAYEGFFQEGEPHGVGSSYLESDTYESYFQGADEYEKSVGNYIERKRNVCAANAGILSGKVKIFLDFPILRPVIQVRGRWKNGVQKGYCRIYSIGGTVYEERK